MALDNLKYILSSPIPLILKMLLNIEYNIEQVTVLPGPVYFGCHQFAIKA